MSRRETERQVQPRMLAERLEERSNARASEQQPRSSRIVAAARRSGSFGTLLISLGVKPKLVQTILRRLATTMDLYVHAYDEDLREAVGTLDRALGS